MRLKDKYWLLTLVILTISILMGIVGYFVTFYLASDNLKRQAILNVEKYLEVVAVSTGSVSKRKELKAVLEKSPLISHVTFSTPQTPSPYQITKKLIFPDGSLNVTIELDKSRIEKSASSLAQKVSLSILAVLLFLQLLIVIFLKKLYLNPLNRIRKDVDLIQSGELKKIPEKGEDEFGRIRKSINKMIDSIKERDERAELISNFIQLLTVGKGFNGEFIELMRKVLKITGTDGVMIGILSNDNTFNIKVITPKTHFSLKRNKDELNGIEPYIFELNREVETSKESLFSAEEKRLGIKYIFGMPLNVLSQTLGYVIFFKRKKEKLPEEVKNFIRNVAKSIGVSVKIKNLISELEEKLDREEKLTQTVIKSFIRSIEIRDSYTRGHSERVAYYSKRIAKELGLPDSEVSKIYMAALLHDIGKIGIPDSILLKPAKLSEEEYEIIKIHPLLSYEILKNIEPLKVSLTGIKYHHERWNGSGYPEGLRRDEIPIDARIIAVADTFDAMTSDRIYRKGMSKKEAVKEIKELAGKLFDPDVVEVALPILLRENPPESRKEFLDYRILSEIEKRRLDYFLRDHLTGAYNRSALEFALALSKERSPSLKAFSVDVTKLRDINVKKGWQEGDRILKSLVQLIEKHIKPLSIVRYSGDNFVFFVPSSVSNEEISEKVKLIEKELGVRLELNELYNVDNVELLKTELTELEWQRPQ
ncbi:diguanylate cyclase (GGDEF) domain-containing protein [Desulfurobacterium pacificum]|uniref:Diguanylate cyclase (GGDEF) domain-containing protein n=1 Tax=Desulfurobacterium pacificum TaxID=240166 RepID=A0ABY1NFP2_9BACT|nr:HD domain-containing phosphohydrolase [Desulfurobacterium pacificum]SMP07988.1 diguanylate cyclase (GGDEF) domain-containing protein [Desulfurobacterium pacificum]